MNKNITIIGDGAWGTALSLLLAQNKNKVCIWSPFQQYADEMKKCRENHKFLPGFSLPESISITSCPIAAVANADAAVIAVPTIYISDTLAKFAGLIKKDTPIVSVSKGFDSQTNSRISEVIKKKLSSKYVAAMSGPSYALEVARGIPTAVTVASENHNTAIFFQELFNCQRFRVYSSTDIIGVELGGALKNIIAIAAGVSDGMGFGDNTKAALITRGLAEIIRVGTALGAMPSTFSGLAGIGDLIVTCTGKLSRNRLFGEQIGRGAKPSEILAKAKNAIEGAWNCKIAKKIAAEVKVDVPIITQVCNLVSEKITPAESVEALLNRTAKPE